MNTHDRLNGVIAGSIGMVVVVYAAVAYCGYFTFGENVEDDILVSYPEVIPVAIVRIALSIAIAWSYPLQLHPTRRCLFSLIWQTEDTEMDAMWYYAVTYGITTASFVISMFVDSLGMALEIIGSVCSPVIAFVLPGLFYYFLQNQDLLGKEELRSIDYKIKKVMAIFLIVFGCCFIPFGLTVQFVF